MYEYINDKLKHGKIDKQWIFFSKGKEYSEAEYNYAVAHGAVPQDFILKGVKVEKPIVKVEKPIVKAVKPKKSRVRKPSKKKIKK